MAWSEYDIYFVGIVPRNISGVRRTHEVQYPARAVEMGTVPIYDAGCNLWVRDVPGRQRGTGTRDTRTDVFLSRQCGGMDTCPGRADAVPDYGAACRHPVYVPMGGSHQRETSER